jgi:hypothetical protein
MPAHARDCPRCAGSGAVCEDHPDRPFEACCGAAGMPCRPPVVERRGLVVHVDGAPTLHLASPVMTRPQDWTPTQAAMLWGPEALARLKARC